MDLLGTTHTFTALKYTGEALNMTLPVTIYTTQLMTASTLDPQAQLRIIQCCILLMDMRFLCIFGIDRVMGSGQWNSDHQFVSRYSSI